MAEPLEFHKAAFAEFLKEDGLLILGKGLGLHQIFVKFLRLYCSVEANDNLHSMTTSRKRRPKKNTNTVAAAATATVAIEGQPSRAPLVFVLHANREAETLVHSMAADGVIEEELPRVIDATVLSAMRSRMYEVGGCFIVTSRVLVVDMLMKRVDPLRISGFLVMHADRVTSTSNESLILRIFRQAHYAAELQRERTQSRAMQRANAIGGLGNNKTFHKSHGFVRAFSEAPESLSAGFAKLSQIMQNLGVRRVHLWPRFHSAIKANLAGKGNITSMQQQQPRAAQQPPASNLSATNQRFYSPEVVELKQPLTPLMKEIQDCIVEAMTACLSELRKSANIDVSEMDVNKALFKSFDATLRRQLDPVWHKVGRKVKQLVTDLGILRRLLPDLLKYDCVSFFEGLLNIQRANQQNMSPAQWLLTDAADRMFVAAQKRIFSVEAARQSHSNATSTGPVRSTFKTMYNAPVVREGGRDMSLVVSLEENPKWGLLREVLEEIDDEVKSTFGTGSDVVVICNDSQTVRQLRMFISTKYTSINNTTFTESGTRVGQGSSTNVPNTSSDGRSADASSTAGHASSTDVPNSTGHTSSEDVSSTLDQGESVLLSSRFYRFLEQRTIMCLRKTRNLDAAAEFLKMNSTSVSPTNSGQMSATYQSRQERNNQAFMAKRAAEQQRRTALGKRNSNASASHSISGNKSKRPKSRVSASVEADAEAMAEAGDQDVDVYVDDKVEDDLENDLMVPLDDDLMVDLASEEREELLMGKLDQIKSSSKTDNIDLTASQENVIDVSATSSSSVQNRPGVAGNMKNVPFRTAASASVNVASEPETGVQRLNAEQQLLLEEYYRRGKLRIADRMAQRLAESQVGAAQLYSGKDSGASTEKKRFGVLDRFHVTLHPRTCVTPTGSVLDELRPRFVVLYDPSLEVIRQVEVYQAQRPHQQIRVYVILYEYSVEEQRFLSDVGRETNAFKKLIEEKSNLVLPEYFDGCGSGGPDRDAEASGPTVIGYNVSTGDPIFASGAKGASSTAGVEGDEAPLVIVDMREFRSALPTLLHAQGIMINPVTLEVGDYILSPDICVERKSISDLFGSFASGRLYKQAEMMGRYYTFSSLLVEFDEGKPFSLHAVQDVSGAITDKSIVSRIVLLTLHFPQLRIFWSPSPRATVDLFRMLKANRKNPNADTAAAVGVPQLAGETRDDGAISAEASTTAQDFLKRLPGVNVHNSARLMHTARSLRGLTKMSIETMSEIMGPTNGTRLYRFLRQKAEV